MIEQLKDHHYNNIYFRGKLMLINIYFRDFTVSFNILALVFLIERSEIKFTSFTKSINKLNIFQQ